MQKLLLRVLPFYEEFTKDQSDNPTGRHQTGRAYHRLGVIRQHLGQLSQADTDYRQAIALLEQLAADYPKVPYYRFDLASSLLNRADLLRRTGNPRDAAQLSVKAKTMLEELVIEFPQVRDYPLYVGFLPESSLSAANRGNPHSAGASLAELFSGKALNELLTVLPLLERKATQRPAVLLDEGLLDQINVTTGKGNPGLFKNGRALAWPLVLRKAVYQTERERVDKLLPEAIRQVTTEGRVNLETLDQLSQDLRRLNDRLNPSEGLSPGQYVSSKRFLKELGEALQLLARPDAGHYLTQNSRPQGKTAEELVKHMMSNGLQFAPAVLGDEAAYVKLYRALESYKDGLGLRARE
jgi:hypothetical protein